MAVMAVAGTGWLGRPSAPDFWSTISAVAAMASASVNVVKRSTAGGSHGPSRAGGTMLPITPATGNVSQILYIEEMNSTGDGDG